LAGEGVVLIDEIELHLHPQWQKTIIPRLLETFPNIQFFITTHSPQVLSAVNGKNIVVLYQNENMDIMYDTVKQSKGLNSSEILEEIFDTLPIDEKAKHTLDGIFQAIDDERFDEAKEDIAKFKQTYGSVPELIRAEALLTLYGVESVDG
ncbi:MAG: AAA family ATPase, partial [Spirochaetales bacterium]|nr:AAA family ATPase [Spirochaetales bacterium]